MKKSMPSISRVTEVCSENPDIKDWGIFLRDQFAQTLRNTSSIEQLESGQTDLETGQADIKRTLSQIVIYLKSSRWESRRSRSWREFAAGTSYFEESLRWWLQAATPRKPLESAFEKLKLPSYENLSKIAGLFGELEEDFDELPNRIVRCELLEKGLSDFENSLEDDETEYLAWCVSLMRDVLDYNNAENLTETHLGLLKKAIKLISEKGPNCSKEDYKNLHKEFLEAGITLIPTTQKAVDKYGQ